MPPHPFLLFFFQLQKVPYLCQVPQVQCKVNPVGITSILTNSAHYDLHPVPTFVASARSSVPSGRQKARVWRLEWWMGRQHVDSLAADQSGWLVIDLQLLFAFLLTITVIFYLPNPNHIWTIVAMNRYFRKEEFQENFHWTLSIIIRIFQ